MKILEALRHFDQSEMEIYLNEDSVKEAELKSLKGKKPSGLTTAIVVMGLLAGSIGLFNYFSSHPSSNQVINRNSALN